MPTDTLRATNGLLSRLPKKDRTRILEACEPVTLEFGQWVAHSEKPIEYVYFPTGAYISLLRPIGHDNIEVALAGDEGMFGWSLSLDVATSNVNALVQGSGTALRMTPRAFVRELGASAALRAMMGRYAYVLMSQFAQTVGCNRFHVVDQRIARWLLMTADRAHSDTFHVTQKLLANMLGVRRAGVTTAARKLQLRRLIRYSRGTVVILNRPALEAQACLCYRANFEAYSSVLG